MGFFNKAKEALRDKTRDKLCEALQKMGVDAQLAERGITEEKETTKNWGWHSKGLIEISKSPIKWVNVVTAYDGQYTRWWNVYLVLEPRVHNIGHMSARSKRVKARPVIGKVINVVWEGDLENDLMARFNEDQYLKQQLTKLKFDVGIGTVRAIDCWAIQSTAGRAQNRVIPTQEEWDCYQSIAGLLLS